MVVSTPERKIEEFAKRLVESGAARPDQVRGCSEEEIERVRADQGLSRLPPIYAAFLRRMGRGAGRLLRGTDAFYPVILGLKQDARDLLAEDAVPYTLPDDSLVLAMHQGYMFFFFPTVAVDSPEVLTYIEGEESARDNERRRGRPAKWPDLVSWLTTELAGTAMMIRSEEARRS